MKPLFSLIYRMLHERGISVQPKSLRKLKTQGLISTVYSVSSSEGKLIIHTLKPTTEHVRQRTWEKVEGVSLLLKDHPEIPSAEIVAGQGGSEEHFLVQKMLPGKPAGSRTLLESSASESWEMEKAAVYPQIEKILAGLHRVHLQGYGWPQFKDGALAGGYESWRGFFETEAPLWLTNIEAADAELTRSQAPQGHERAKRFIEKVLHSRLLRFEGGVLIHGDSINPSNILVERGVVSGILDWEWSLVGDPAWEFCDPAWDGVYAQDRLAPYAQAYSALMHKRLDVGGLMKRVRLYRPLWLLWSASLHAQNPRGLLYAILRDMLESELQKAPV